MPKEGEVIAGRYDLIAHLGDGGTASVWKAADRTLQREVAIKFLYVVDERAVEDMRKQFLREARIACAVKHRNVIQTMDFGQTEDARAYMVMELLHGEELSDRIGRAPELSMSEIVQTIGGVLRGLQAIHEAGIVHRDLKPENVYLERDDEGIYPKILDFGIAKSVDRRSGSRRSVLTTKEGVIVGTPEYMSPEQARGQRDLDGRSDVWSVGVILFELLSGVLPFDAPSEADIIIKVVTTDAPRLSQIAAHTPPQLEALVTKALRRDRGQRFQTASEMLQALLEAERTHGDARSGATRRRKQQRAALWLSGAAAVAVGGLWAFPARPMLPPPSPAAANDSEARANANVTVELRGVPDSATVLVNGKPHSGTKLVLPDDGFSRLIEVQAPGLQAWRVMHPAGNNARYEVRMPSALKAAPAVAEQGPTLIAAPPRTPPTAAPRPQKAEAPARKSSPHRAEAEKKPESRSPALIRDLDF